MTKSQHKKHLARLFNLHRDERLAYEMDVERYPKPKPKPKTKADARAERRKKLTAQQILVLAASVSGMPKGWNSP